MRKPRHDADVRGRLGEPGFERFHRELAGAQAKGSVFGVAGEIEKQRGAIAVGAGVFRAALELAQRGEQIVGIGVEEEHRVCFWDAADTGEDRVQLSRVISGVEQLAGAGSALVVSSDQCEAANRPRGGGRRFRHRRPALLRLNRSGDQQRSKETRPWPSTPLGVNGGGVTGDHGLRNVR